MHTVSVIIPTYDREKTLVRAIKSVLAQTYEVNEILICDDGSTDNSKEVVSALGDARIRWIDCNRNGRPAVPRNKGMATAKGEWLAFLDSDDEWLPNKIADQLSAADKTGLKAICTNAIRIIEEKHSPFFQFGDQRITFDELVKTNKVICSSMIIQKLLIAERISFPVQKELAGLEDYSCWLRVAAIGEIYYLSKPLVNYYDDPKNSIRKDDVSYWEQRNRIFKDLASWSREVDKKDIHAKANKEIIRAKLFLLRSKVWKLFSI